MNQLDTPCPVVEYSLTIEEFGNLIEKENNKLIYEKTRKYSNFEYTNTKYSNISILQSPSDISNMADMTYQCDDNTSLEEHIRLYNKKFQTTRKRKEKNIISPIENSLFSKRKLTDFQKNSKREKIENPFKSFNEIQKKLNFD